MLQFILIWHDAETNRPAQSCPHGTVIVAYRGLDGNMDYYALGYSKRYDKFNVHDDGDLATAFEDERTIAWAYLPTNEFWEDNNVK